MVKIIVGIAAKDGIIQKNPLDQIETEEKPRENDDAGRVYLTIDEIRKMAETECEKEVIKRAFMFSCFCGLRISDIRKLKWKDIEQTTDGDENAHYRLTTTMQKTQKTATLICLERALTEIDLSSKTHLTLCNTVISIHFTFLNHN